MNLPPRRIVAVGAALAAMLLLLAAPSPASAVRALRTPTPGADPTEPLVALVSLVAWALAGWLLLTVALTAGAHLPGRLGSASRSAARRVAPAAVRRVVEVTLGLSVVVGVVGTAPAAASPGPAAGPPAAPSLDWSAQAGTERAADLDWAASPVAAPQPGAEVVVAPGDSLWELAEQDLAARTGTTPTDAEVAQAWPSWWAANREAVGDDPDLIQPGTRLSPPADLPPEPSAS